MGSSRGRLWAAIWQEPSLSLCIEAGSLLPQHLLSVFAAGQGCARPAGAGQRDAVGCSSEDAEPSHGVAGTEQPCWRLSLQCVLPADVCYCLFLASLISLRGKLKLQRETPEKTRTREAAEGKLPAGSTFCRCSLFTHLRALQPHGAVKPTRGAETNRKGLL